MDISKIDKNFKVDADLGETDIVWYDVEEAPFEIYGVTKGEKSFVRMPPEIAAEASENVKNLSYHCSGGRIRFSTNSPYIAVKIVMPYVTHFAHMTMLAASGSDLYLDEDGKSEYVCSMVPPANMTAGYEFLRKMWPAIRREVGEDLCYTLNMPIYNEVTKFYVGIKEGSTLGPGAKYRDLPPVLFYGSSITQGACAARPGNTYESMISRALNVDYINFGFSGSCKGEKPLATYFSGLDASVFVCDYDHNTPSGEHLENTYFAFYEEYRKKQPTTPYIMVSRVDCLWNSQKHIDDARNIIYRAYLKARELGDENVYFIDGGKIFEGSHRGECLSDGGHPTDIGFMRMSNVIGGLVGEILKDK